MPSPQHLLLPTLVLTLVLNYGPASTSKELQTNSRLLEPSTLTAQRGPYGKRPHRGIGRRERLAISIPDRVTPPGEIGSSAPIHIEHLRNTRLARG